MRETIRRGVAVGLAVLMGAVLAAGQTEMAKIKVVSDAAVIYAKPDLQSQVLDRPPVGTLLDLVRRDGEWVEVRFRSKLGMVLSGFIPKDAVEPPAGEAIEPAKSVAPPPIEAKPAKPELKPRPGWPFSHKILQIGLGGFVSKTKVGGSRRDAWPFRGEELSVEDTLSDASMSGLDVRIGIMPLAFLEVEATFHSASPSLTGTFRIGVPNAYIAGDPDYDESEEVIPFKSSLATLGIVFHPLKRGILLPYLGFGVAFGSASLKVLKDITFEETVYTPGYRHEVKIKTVKYEDADAQATGWTARLGLDVALVPALYLFAEGIYASAGQDVKLPLASTMSHREVNRRVQMGGARAAFGLKIRI